MLSEKSQRNTNIVWQNFYVESKKSIQQTTEYNKKEADLQIQRTNSGYKLGEGRGEGHDKNRELRGTSY